MELWAHQPHLSPWEGDGAANPGNRFQLHKRQTILHEQPAWLHHRDVVGQLDKLLQQMTGLVGEGRTADIVLRSDTDLVDSPCR